MPIVGILLAAGYSRRFGSDKLLYPIDNTLPIGVVSARKLVSTVKTVLAVIRPEQVKLKQLLVDEGASVVECPNSAKGQGASLAYAIEKTKNADGWIISLADMPFIQQSTIEVIINMLDGPDVITAPTYNCRRGHPVGFGRNYLSELLLLKSDRGAKRLLTKYDNHIKHIPCNDPGILNDIDTTKDLP